MFARNWCEVEMLAKESTVGLIPYTRQRGRYGTSTQINGRGKARRKPGGFLSRPTTRRPHASLPRVTPQMPSSRA